MGELYGPLLPKGRRGLFPCLIEGAQSSAARTSRCDSLPPSQLPTLTFRTGWRTSLSPSPIPLNLWLYSPLRTKGQSVVLNSPPLRQAVHPSENRVFARHNLIFLNLSTGISWVLPTDLTCTSTIVRPSLWLLTPGVEVEAVAEDEISTLTGKNCHWDHGSPLAQVFMAFFLHVSLDLCLSF